MIASDWSLCLQSRHGRKIVKLSSTASLEDLYTLASSEFGTAVSALKYGFPPRPIDRDATTAISDVFSNQERITVELGVAVAPTLAPAGPAATTTTTTTTTTTRKSKRAASKAATEAMPQVIKAQEAMMKQQAKPKRKAVAITTSSSSPRKRPPPAPKFNNASVGAGRRLADGAAVATTTSPRKRKAPSSSLLGEQDKKPQDMSEALLGALDNKGKMGQVLRKGMKNAVQSSYETTRAFSRLAAIQAKSYQALVSSHNKLTITYQGTVDKTKTTETVDCIPRDVLKAVIKGIHASNEQALRPENLALLSPRVLWSLVHVFPHHASVEECYRELFADDDLDVIDWKFLRRRAPQLSEKAMENLRQTSQKDDDDDINVEQAAEAVAAVEHAMEHLHDYEAQERQSTVARAALARLHAPQPTALEQEWKLVTPCEPDEDELLQIINVPAAAEPANFKPNEMVQQLFQLGIHNWRELANQKDVANLATTLQVPEEHVQQWIDRAQDESLPEIMVEICNDTPDHVDLLIEQARTGTPKDLANWRCIPDMLWNQVGSPSTFTGAELAMWCDRAHALLQEWEWLNWYATPVE
jgi:hypothetical protein